MLSNPSSSARSWKRILVGLATAALLVPVPVFATMTYSAAIWSADQTFPFGPFSGLSYADSSTSTVATFYQATTLPSNFTGTVTVTVRGITSATSDPITGFSSGFDNVSLSAGSFGLSVGVSPSADNMFQGSPSDSQNFLGNATGSTTTITFTFVFSNASFRQSSTSPYLTIMFE